MEKSSDSVETKDNGESKYLAVIREWKYYWMNQKQNSEEDYDNYHRRAFGIDANMMHHLASLLVKSETQNVPTPRK